MNKVRIYIGKISHYIEAQELRGKISFLKLFLDIVLCSIVYGATISDYFIYRFYEKKHFARKKFMTARDKNRFYAAMNDVSSRWVVQNKDAFNEKFAEYLKRESINIPESDEQTFCDFVKAHEAVFIKPIALGGGDGILKVSADKAIDLTQLYNDIVKKGTHVVEAAIIQHPDMAAMHPQSINSIRVATFFDGENVEILFAEMRCGTGDSYVDNHMSDGIVMIIDKETGKICSLASSKKRLNIVRHPDTNVFIPGFQIPHWDKCLALVDHVARQVENIRYVGWDIAVTPDDVCLIEANPSGDFNVFQEPTQTGCKAEMDALIKKVVN